MQGTGAPHLVSTPQVCTSLSEQRRVPGLHAKSPPEHWVDVGLQGPAHVPAPQTNGHGGPEFSHWPCAHVCGCKPLHRSAPFTQTGAASAGTLASTSSETLASRATTIVAASRARAASGKSAPPGAGIVALARPPQPATKTHSATRSGM